MPRPIKPVRLTLAPLALAVLLIGTEQASAGCQLQWQPDPFGGSGGYLDYVCNDPSAPTGNAGSGGKKERKKPTHAAIVVSLATLNDGDLTFSGAYSAGYASKGTAVKNAKRACRREFGGRCKPFATARNGWAALVATLTADDRLRVFGGSAKQREPALREATRRARAAFGGDPPHDIQPVRAVRSKTGRRR